MWDHVEAAYQFNTQSGFRIHRYLTKEHVELTSSTKMRNRLAEQVLDKDMLFLMKSYQATLDKPELVSSTVCFLENSSVLVDVFTDRRPVCEPSDKRLRRLGEVLEFFLTLGSPVWLSLYCMLLQNICFRKKQGTTWIRAWLAFRLCAMTCWGKETALRLHSWTRTWLKIISASSAELVKVSTLTLLWRNTVHPTLPFV